MEIYLENFMGLHPKIPFNMQFVEIQSVRIIFLFAKIAPRCPILNIDINYVNALPLIIIKPLD